MNAKLNKTFFAKYQNERGKFLHSASSLPLTRTSLFFTASNLIVSSCYLFPLATEQALLFLFLL